MDMGELYFNIVALGLVLLFILSSEKRLKNICWFYTMCNIDSLMVCIMVCGEDQHYHCLISPVTTAPVGPF